MAKGLVKESPSKKPSSDESSKETKQDSPTVSAVRESNPLIRQVEDSFQSVKDANLGLQATKSLRVLGFLQPDRWMPSRNLGQAVRQKVLDGKGKMRPQYREVSEYLSGYVRGGSRGLYIALIQVAVHELLAEKATE